MLSRLAVGIGWLWCLLLCLTAWTWGGKDDPNEDLTDVLWYLLFSLSGLVSAVWAAVLVREQHGRWLLAALPIGAFVGTVFLTVGEVSEAPDSLFLLMFVVILGVPFVVGVAIGYLWRFAARRRQGEVPV